MAMIAGAALPEFTLRSFLLGSVPVATVAYILYQCLLSPLAKVPGPFWAKLTDLYRVYFARRGTTHRHLIALHKKYGKLVRIAPNHVSVVDAQAFQEIYKAGNQFYKSKVHSIGQGSRKFDLLNERNERVHGHNRSLVARAYTMESALGLESKVNETICILLRKFDKIQAEGRVIDLSYWLQLFAFDTIGSMSFSRTYDYLEGENDNGMFSRLHETFASVAWLVCVGWYWRIHQRVMPIVGSLVAANNLLVFFAQFTRQEFKARKDRSGDDRDILGQLVTIQKRKPELTDENIASMMISNVFAGSDTTSTGLSGIFYMLLKNPVVLQKLMQELDEKRGNGELSEPVSAKQAESSEYLQAVLYEGMRLIAPFGVTMDREVPAGGLTVNGLYLPSGTVIGTSPWPLHRAPEIWGPDVDEFRPERWLGEIGQGLKRYFFTFGGGSRTCIGRNISWLEIEKLVPTLLMRYNFRLATDEELKETCAGLVFVKGLNVTLSLREQ